MANRVLSIEIGQSLTRVVEIDYMVKNPKIYSCFSFETPDDFVSDGKVKANEIFLAQLKNGLRENKIKTTKVVFTIYSGKIANRDITIPMVKENKVAGLLMNNSAEYFPVDLKQYQLVHRIVDKIETKEAKQYKLKVLAVPNDLVSSYEELAAYCGLTLLALDYTGNSIVQVMKRNHLEHAGVVIKIDESNSMITMLKEGKVSLQRNISYGINEAVETLQDSEVYGSGLSYTDAVNVMRRKTCIRRHLDTDVDYREEEDTELTIMNTRKQVTESLRMLIGNIRRVLDYYISTNSDTDIDSVELIGLGADFSGLSKLMTNELGIKVTSLQKLPETNLNRSIDETTFKVAEFVACIGAAFKPMNFVLGDKIEEHASKKEVKDSLTMAGIVFSACILVTAGMLIFGFGTNIGLKSENKALNNRIKDLNPAKTIYDDFVQTHLEYNDSSQIKSLTQTPQDGILDFLKEMESNMPSDIIVNNLSANAEGINMSLTMSSKEAAAEALVQLRNFHSIASVSTTGIKDETDETGIKKVTFSVNCSFASGSAVETPTSSAVQ